DCCAKHRQSDEASGEETRVVAAARKRRREVRRLEPAARAEGARHGRFPKGAATMEAHQTYGGDLASTWSILRQSCKPRSPVGLVKQPAPMQVRRTNSHSLPNLVR